MQFLLKALISGLVIAGVSELARRSTFAASLLVSLPLLSILSMIWLWHDTHDAARIAALSYGIFWVVIPSLLFFLILPFLLKHNFRFSLAMLLSCAGMMIGYWGYVWALRKMGIEL